MVCLGFEPRAAGWLAQTIRRSYGNILNLVPSKFCHLIWLVRFTSLKDNVSKENSRPRHRKYSTYFGQGQLPLVDCTSNSIPSRKPTLDYTVSLIKIIYFVRVERASFGGGK